MDLSSGEISSLIFQRRVKNDLGDFSLDRQALVVYMELDGKATLEALAEKSGLNMATMRELIANLLQLGLIEPVETDIVAVDNDFLRYLVDQLALAVGPIAGVLIEDEIQNLKCDVSDFPGYRAAELVDKLAEEIRREEKRSIFKKNMNAKIREKGYSND